MHPRENSEDPAASVSDPADNRGWEHSEGPSRAGGGRIDPTSRPPETPELTTLFRVDVGPGVVRVHGVVDGVSVPVVLEAITLAAAKAADGQVEVQLSDVNLLSASSTRWLQHAIDQAWKADNMVTLVAPHGSIANRVITSIRRLLGPHAHRLPLDPGQVRFAREEARGSEFEVVDPRDPSPPAP